MEPGRSIPEIQVGLGALTNNTAGETSVAANEEEKTVSAALQALDHPYCEDVGGAPEVNLFFGVQKGLPGYLQLASKALKLDPEVILRAIRQDGSR